MKRNCILYNVLIFGLIAGNTSCQNEELSPYIEPQSGVHAYAKLAEDSPESFAAGDLTTPLDINIQWVSIDQQLDVESIDLYVLFNEDYTDEDGNPLVAEHGGEEGVFFQTIDASQLSNRENTTFTITQQDILGLYEGATFDYDEDDTAEPVFSNSFKPSRTAGQPFIGDDTFVIRWELTTTDGLLFDSWSPSVCTEFETYTGELPNDGGFNCEISWGVSE